MTDSEREDQYRREVANLMRENAAIRAQSAKIVYALDCSAQLIEALLAWLPEGLVLSGQVSNAKAAWSKAMQDINK